jgi:hypothetical protein
MNSPNPVTPSPVTAGAIPWYKSPQTIGLVTTFVSAAIALFPKVGQLLGMSSPGDVSNAVSTVFGFIAVAAPFIGTIVRAKSKEQPLTMTQAAADSHPATQAVIQTQAAMRADNIPTAVETQAKIEAAPTVKPTVKP